MQAIFLLTLFTVLMGSPMVIAIIVQRHLRFSSNPLIEFIHRLLAALFGSSLQFIGFLLLAMLMNSTTASLIQSFEMLISMCLVSALSLVLMQAGPGPAERIAKQSA